MYAYNGTLGAVASGVTSGIGEPEKVEEACSGHFGKCHLDKRKEGKAS